MQTMIDPATLRAVEKAGEAARQALIRPGCCMEGTCCELPPCHCSRAASIAAIAAFLDEMGQDSAAARVRRCVGQQTKGDA
jgi:hypothetical protein